MRTLKFGLSQRVINTINLCNKEELIDWKNVLEKEIKSGILTDVKYKKELELVKSRLN